jgi:septal ring factor EnvC (AmiA/AmiB activator)
MPYFILTFLLLIAPQAFAASGLHTSLEEVEKQIIEINTTIKEVELKITEGEQQLQEKQQEEAVIRQKLIKQLHTFNDTVKNIVRVQRLPQKALMVVDGLQGHSQRRNIVEKGQNNLQSLIEQDKQELSGLLENLNAQEDILQDLNTLKENLQTKQTGFNKLRQIQVKLLQPETSEREALIQQAQELEQTLDLAKLLTHSPITKRAGTNITYNNLPVDGEIITTYNQKDATGISAQGITIASTPSANVKAMKDGHVIYSSTFREYGYLVILEHSDGYHTLYSGLNGSSKEIGDFISAGDTIGILPAVEKPTLYLEVRDNGKTVNPKKLLKIAKNN